jgi:hypothetical protein
MFGRRNTGLTAVEVEPVLDMRDSISGQLCTLSRMGHMRLRNGWCDNRHQWLAQIEIDNGKGKLEVTTEYWNTPEGAILDMIARLKVLGVTR